MDTQRYVDTIKAPPNLLYLLHRRQVIGNAFDIEFETLLPYTSKPGVMYEYPHKRARGGKLSEQTSYK